MSELLTDISSELKGAWRFRWVALGVAWLVCLVGWLVVYAYPDSYESTAKVYVDTNSALGPLLEKMTVDSDVLSRVDQVTTAMLGRPQLAKVARETDMHLRAKNDDQFDGLLSGLRKRIDILNDRRDPNLFVISYSDHEPKIAQDVVIKLLNIFVEDTLGENRVDSQKAQEFLKQQLEQLDEELSASEQKLAQFKRENVGRMPSESGDYFGRLQAEMTALEETRAALRIALRRQSALRQQMAGEAPTLDSNSGLQSDLDRRIDESESRLQELELRFTERHPDVVSTRETIAQLKAQKQTELSELLNAGGTGIASDNPVFQNIQIELTNVSVEIATLREQEESQQRKVSEYRDLIDVLPKVEAELARLTRDYDVKQSQYQSLLQRLEVAELSDSAEQSEDVKFRVIDPPMLPDDPVAPDRPLIILLILLAGLGAGAGISYLLNLLNPVFSHTRTLRQVTGLPVLGSVQIMRTSERNKWRMAQVLSFSGGVVVLCAICVIVLLFHEKGSQAIQALV